MVFATFFNLSLNLAIRRHSRNQRTEMDWNAKVEETPGVTGKFGLGVQSEAG